MYWVHLGANCSSVGATPSFRFAICCFAHICPVSGIRTEWGPFPRPFTFPDCHLPSCDDEDRHCFIQYRYGRGAPWIREALNDGLCWARIDGGSAAGASGWQRAHCLRRIRGTLNDGLCCCRARIDGGSVAGASGWQRAHCLHGIRGAARPSRPIIKARFGRVCD